MKMTPQSKQNIRETMMTWLYAEDERMAREALDAIIDEHCRLTGNTISSFMFHGKVYQPAHVEKRIVAPALHPDLHDRMLAYYKDRLLVDREEKLIIGNLFTAVMNMSESPGDWMKLLPPAVHSPIERIVSFNTGFVFELPHLSDAQVEAFQAKQERFLNMLKGRLALNLIF